MLESEICKAIAFKKKIEWIAYASVNIVSNQEAYEYCASFYKDYFWYKNEAEYMKINSAILRIIELVKQGKCIL